MLVALPLLVCAAAGAQDAWDSTVLIRGRVVDARGLPVVGAVVSLYLIGAVQFVRYRPEFASSGSSEFQPIDGQGPLHVFAPGFAPALCVDERPDDDGAIVVRLNAGAVVRGRVVDRDGFGISGAMVELADAAEPLDALVSARVGRVRSRGPLSETDDFGGFVLRCVPAGRWRIRAGARGFAPAESPVLRTMGDEIHVVPSIALPDAAAIVVRGGDDGFTAEVDASRSFAQFPASASTRLDLAPGTVVRLRRNLVGCLMSDSCTTTVPAEGDVVVTLP